MHSNEIIKTFEHYLGESNISLDFCERFLGGMSNYTYHVRVKGKDYVIRIANPDGKIFVSYEGEKLHLKLLEDLGITSKTVYYDLTTGNKISEYIPGHNLADEISDTDYAAVAALLHTLHNTKIYGLDYGKVNRLADYEAILNHPLDPLFYEIKAFWLNELNTTYKNVKYVFTHGDAQRSNIIKNDDQYFLLDFEFAGLNDPFYDIASFGNIAFADSLKLLKFYLKRSPKDNEIRRVMFNRLYQVLQWHLVATHKEDTGLSAKLHIDFKAFSDKYLAFANHLMNEIKTLKP